MAGEIEVPCRADSPQPGRTRALRISELTGVSCICADSSSLSSQLSREKLHLRNKNFTQRTMTGHGTPVALQAVPAEKVFGGPLTWFKLKLYLHQRLSSKNNSLAESCLKSVQFRHLLTSSPYASSPFPTMKERGEPTSSCVAPHSPFLSEQ